MPPKHTTGVPETTAFLLHFEQPYKHARHYFGLTTEPLDKRLQAHAAGYGSRLMKAVGDAGIPWRLVRLWEPIDTDTERAIRRRHMSPRLCPICRAATPARPTGMANLHPADRLAAGAGMTRLRPSTLAELADLERRWPRWTTVARHGREQTAGQVAA